MINPNFSKRHPIGIVVQQEQECFTVKVSGLATSITAFWKSVK